MYEQYALNPNVTRQRLFYETMEDILPDLKVIINDGQTQTVLPLDSFADVSVTSSGSDGGDK